MKLLASIVFPFAIFALTLQSAVAEDKPIRVLVWDEQQPTQKRAYGDKFLGETIAVYLAAQSGIETRNTNLTATEQGLTEASLDATDVLIWWGHAKHKDVNDDYAERVVDRVRQGKLGLIVLHSGHWSKPFVRLMQERAKSDAQKQIPEAERATAKIEIVNDKPIGKPVKADTPLTPSLEKHDGVWRLTLPQCVFPSWREDGEPGHMTTLLPKHPIAAGLPEKWDVTHTEMYSEPFHVPTPDELVFEERWDKGEHFRSGCVWRIEKGRVFYFRPGHETFPVYRQAEPLNVVENAVRWLAKPEEKAEAGK